MDLFDETHPEASCHNYVLILYTPSQASWLCRMLKSSGDKYISQCVEETEPACSMSGQRHCFPLNPIGNEWTKTNQANRCGTCAGPHHLHASPCTALSSGAWVTGVLGGLCRGWCDYKMIVAQCRSENDPFYIPPKVSQPASLTCTTPSPPLKCFFFP